MKFTPYLMLLAAVLCISLFFSCTSSGLEFPPPPEGYNSSEGNSSSSSDGSQLSSSSQCAVGFDGDKFIDSRDSIGYKYEIAPNGRVWMSENLNYSRGGTIGFCYKTGDETVTLGTPGEDLPGCEKPNGRNYTYEIATNGQLDVDKAPGICPERWHIPNQAEWNTITGSGKMSTNFYVMSGNYDVNVPAWQNRKPPASEGGGFYWFSNAVKNRGIALVQIDGWGLLDPPSIKFKLAPDPYGGLATADNDYFSVRCIMNEDFQPTCGGSPLDLATQKCVCGVLVARE